MFNVTTDGAPIPAGAHTIRILKVRFQLSPIAQHPEQDFSPAVILPFYPMYTVNCGHRRQKRTGTEGIPSQTT